MTDSVFCFLTRPAPPQVVHGSGMILPVPWHCGQVFRLRGKGIKGVRSHAHGDLFCHVAIETPINLTARQKDLLREFEAINAEDPGTHNPRAKNWFDRVREFFGP